MIRPPRNGESLLRLRREGMRPEGLVLVSLIGRLPYSNYTLYADAEMSWDWSMLAGLDVELVASSSIPFRRVLRALVGLADACPSQMTISYAEGSGVDCGASRRTRLSIVAPTDRMLFDWCPMAVGHDSQSILIARRLWRELGNSIPDHFGDAMRRIAHQAEREIAHGVHHS